MRNPHVLQAIETLAGFVHLDGVDDITEIHVDIHEVAVTVIEKDKDGRSFVRGSDVATITHRKHWRTA